MVARYHEDLVGRSAPVRAERHGVLGGLDHPGLEGLLGGRRCADQAPAGEPVETGQFVRELPRHERDPEQLAVRVGDGGTGLATVVDDHLAVAQAGSVLVLLHAVADGQHHERHLLVGQRRHRCVVVRRDDEHFVDSTRRSLGEHRSPIFDHERRVALKSRVAVRKHTHEPGARGPIDLEGWRCRGLHTWAERARDSLEGVERELSRHEERLSLGAIGGHRHPASRERINAKLVHAGTRTSFETELRQIVVISFHAIAATGCPSRPSG